MPNTETCLSCRLISGFGVVGIGAYLYAQSQKSGKFQMTVMRILAAGAVGLGLARLLNMKFIKSPEKNK